jgi:ubiquitin-protein ligase
MNVLRIRSDIQRAIEHFPNIDTHTTNDGSIYIKAALQTSAGQMYIICVTFSAYPSEMPKVTVITPPVTHTKHMYKGGYICYMHPSMWNPARHDLKFVLGQAAVWLNKHEIYMRKRIWPGPELAHAS